MKFAELNDGDVFRFDAGNGFGCIAVKRKRPNGMNAVYSNDSYSNVDAFFMPDQEVELLISAPESA